MLKPILSVVIAIALLLFGAATKATAQCSFGAIPELTFAQEISERDFVVIATLTEPPILAADSDVARPKATFEVAEVLKGDEPVVAAGMNFKASLSNRAVVPKAGQKFLVMGYAGDTVVWRAATAVSERLVEHIKKYPAIPAEGPERLAYFLNFLEDSDSLIAVDAYRELAVASYSQLVELKDRMDREALLGWIKDPRTITNHRALYFTMLGICGQGQDSEFIEKMIVTGAEVQRSNRMSMFACYLSLKKEEGMDLIEARILSSRDATFVDAIYVLAAFRFHTDVVDIIPKQRIVRAARMVLENPLLADLVINDLADWEDWASKNKLVQMFKDADDDSFVRFPIVNYLQVCPDEDAEELIEELRKIDPASVRRSEFFMDDGSNDEKPDQKEN